jgi:antibiotic biosynthesis monooxygenase (ABM) superfamily enzyme
VTDRLSAYATRQHSTAQKCPGYIQSNSSEYVLQVKYNMYIEQSKWRVTNRLSAYATRQHSPARTYPGYIQSNSSEYVLQFKRNIVEMFKHNSVAIFVCDRMCSV